MSTRLWILLAAVLTWASGWGSPRAAAQTPLLPANPLATFSYFDSIAGGSAVLVPVSGQPFSQAVRITTTGGGSAIYNAQLSWTLNAASVNAGDLGLMTFWARRVSPLGTPVQAILVLERNGGDYAKSLSTTLPSDGTWRRYAIAFRMSDAFQPGQSRLAFQFSAGPQSFELGGITLVNYAPSVNPATLGLEFYYPGRDANAPWRAQAAAAIQQFRTSPITVRVVNPSGQPIAGATVRVRQTSHAFKFGSALNASTLVGTGRDADRYRAKVTELFNVATIENHLKWPFWETWGRTDADRGVDWLSQRRIPVRGHNLVWPNWDNMPPDAQALASGALRTRIDGHFDSILSTYRSRIFEWDVVNEPFSSFDVMGRIGGVPGVPASNGTLGNAEIVRWFQRARASEPGLKLALNDYNLLEGVDDTHRAYTLALLDWMRTQGAPVDTLGLQGHFGLVPIPQLQARIAQFAALPVRLAITEYDLPTLDDQLQADYLRDVLTLVFAEPKFDQFIMWGFWEGAHWMPEAAMYRRDWSIKPAGTVWSNLTRQQWWTDASGKTWSDGTFATRAYKGELIVEATWKGTQSGSARVTLSGSSGAVTVQVGPRTQREPELTR